ncbi:MAG: hypothetical protein HYU78_17580 [Rhodocyclales bacterium]|nr:hypothetical protein [Rhodocyclales bacterium]
MNKHGRQLLALVGAALLTATPVAAAPASGSDNAFNAMILEMSGQDTGSAWFDYYVETVNQQIASKSAEEPFGAAGPSGPLVGFDGYVAGFVEPDTGSQWFDLYVDSVRRVLRAKEQR